MIDCLKQKENIRKTNSQQNCFCRNGKLTMRSVLLCWDFSYLLKGKRRLELCTNWQKYMKNKRNFVRLVCWWSLTRRCWPFQIPLLLWRFESKVSQNFRAKIVKTTRPFTEAYHLFVGSSRVALTMELTIITGLVTGATCSASTHVRCKRRHSSPCFFRKPWRSACISPSGNGSVKYEKQTSRPNAQKANSTCHGKPAARTS